MPLLDASLRDAGLNLATHVHVPARAVRPIRSTFPAVMTTLIGIKLRKPTFNEVTASTIMGVGLWVALVGLLQAGGRPLDRFDAGAALLIAVWASVAARCGIRVHAGGRHLALNLAVSAVLLGLYQAAFALLH